MKKELEKLHSFLSENFNTISEERLQSLFNRFSDELITLSQDPEIDSVIDWLNSRKEKLEASVKKIPLKDISDDWYLSNDSGNYEHVTNGFFKIIGVRTETSVRESGKGWDQPMIDQGTESSVAGLIMKRFEGIPHYLIEAKFEPGNYDKILLSPTLQVTYDNLNKLHGGRKPAFAEYFNGEMQDVRILHDKWYPEDGGRFYLKRVKNIIIETTNDIDITDDFKWINIFQLRAILDLDNIANQHLRSLMSIF